MRNSFGDITSVTTTVNGTAVEVVEYTYSEIDSDGDGKDKGTVLCLDIYRSSRYTAK